MSYVMDNTKLYPEWLWETKKHSYRKINKHIHEKEEYKSNAYGTPVSNLKVLGKKQSV